ADEYLLADFSDGEKDINLLMTFYKSQTKGSGIHSPEICLPGGGWEVSQWQQRTITVGSDGEHQSFPVNRAIIQQGLERQLVYFWFEQRGRRITNDFEAKFASMWDTFADGRSDGGLVRVVTPLTRTEDVELADERLQNFLSSVVPQLPSYFPAIEN
ncbi:MAG: EpsI family protein, partial [Rhodobacteraceae bacterium]|nr:EpsI family protein [Paracoccaceae bacterium]